MAPSRHHPGTIPVPSTPAPPAGCGHAPAATRPVTIRATATRPAPAARGSGSAGLGETRMGGGCGGRGVGYRPPTGGGGLRRGAGVERWSRCGKWAGMSLPGRESGVGVPVWGGEGGTRGGAGAPVWGEDQGIAPQFGRFRPGAQGWQWGRYRLCRHGAGRATIPLLVKPSPRGDRARSFPLAPSPFWGTFQIERPLPP